MWRSNRRRLRFMFSIGRDWNSGLLGKVTPFPYRKHGLNLAAPLVNPLWCHQEHPYLNDTSCAGGHMRLANQGPERFSGGLWKRIPTPNPRVVLEDSGMKSVVWLRSTFDRWLLVNILQTYTFTIHNSSAAPILLVGSPPLRKEWAQPN